MALIKRTQVVDRPVDEVFATVIDAGNYASWNPTIKASRRMDEGEIGQGSRFEWKLRGFGIVIQEFEEFQRNERVRIVPQLKSLAGGHRFLFTAEGERTRIDHELEMIPRGVFRLMGPMMARTGTRNLRATAQALQAHLERGQAKERAAD
jgi:ligand-binding SRPBCC domain-containing protein